MSYPDAATANGRPAARLLAGLVLFGLAFGYVEAAAAIYLRGLYEPIHRRVYPDVSPEELFPLIPLERLETEEGQGGHWLAIELGREAATLLMLAAVGLCVGRNFREGFAAFVVAFGAWDVFYYAFLKVWLDWPRSLLDWDLLFLLPVPWAGPVLAALVVALAMIAAGAVVLVREAAGRPLVLTGIHWLGFCAGGVLITMAFCLDYQRLLSGAAPGEFPWTVFAAGLAVGLAAWLHACRAKPPRNGA
jgi:hypothetical protein